MRKGIMSLESIQFQNGELFKALTECVKKVRESGRSDIRDPGFFLSEEGNGIVKTIKFYTNLSVTLLNGQNSGPYVLFPMLGANSMLLGNDHRKSLLACANLFDSAGCVRDIMSSLQKDIVHGSVNLKNSTVDGVYAEFNSQLFMPPSMFVKGSPFCDEEAAAAMLHELGHVFTFMEFVTRTVSTNQVLAGMVRAMDKTIPEDQRTTIFARGIDIMRMNSAQQAALLNAKSQKEVGFVVLDAAVQLSVSELGASVYDVNDCEQLADQFAARHGAGRYFVTAVDKYMKIGGWRIRTAADWRASAIGQINLYSRMVFCTLATLGTIWLYVLFAKLTAPDKANNKYDNEKSRFLRVKHDNVERLKDKTIGADEKKTLLADNEVIDEVAKYYEDNLSFIEKLSYFFSPTYRNAHKYEVLQKELEGIAFNDLFSSAAKFSTI